MRSSLKNAACWVLCLWRVLWLVPLVAVCALVVAVAFVGFGPKLAKAAIEMVFDL